MTEKMTKNDEPVVVKTPVWGVCIVGVGALIFGLFLYAVFVAGGPQTVMGWVNVVYLLYLVIMGVWVLATTVGRTFIFDDRGVTSAVFGKALYTIPWNDIVELDYETRDGDYEHGCFRLWYFKDKEMRKYRGLYLKTFKYGKELEVAIKNLPVSALTKDARTKIHEMGLWAWKEKYDPYSHFGKYAGRCVRE